MKKFIAPVAIAFSLASMAGAALDDVAGIWQFDNNLNESGGGTALSAIDFVPAYTSATIGGEAATVLDLDPLGTTQTLAMANTTGANGGGGAAFTNNWTVVMDVNLEFIGTFQSLIQTDPNNLNDQDVFVRPNGQVDFGPNVSDAGAIAPDTWYRIAFTCGNDGNGGALACTAYIDGTQTTIGGVPQVGASGLDGVFSLDTVVNFFADESNETDDMLVNSIAFWGEALTASEVAALGAASAGGITIPENPKLCPADLACVTSIDPDTVVLTWTPGENLDATGVEILRDNVVIATLPLTAATHTDTPTVPPGATYTDFVYGLRVVGNDAGMCPALASEAQFYGGEIGDGSVLHLPLDSGNVDDISGLDNDGLITGTVTQGTGRISDAAVFDSAGNPIQSIRVEDGEGLNFGADIDFTVSVWVNSLGFVDDPGIISNKDWASGNNVGWIIAAAPDGHWQWNIGNGTGRRDYDGPAGQISDGAWHHLLVSHDRDGEAVLYFDGVEVARRDISGFGNLDTPLPIGVGNDGTLNYTTFPGSIDDPIIWRRTVTAGEVAKLHELGLANMTISHAGPPKICPSALVATLDSRDPYTVILNWSGSQNLDSTGIEVLLGGTVLATLAPDATSYIDMPAVAADSYIDLEYSIRMVGGDDSADCPEVTSTLSFYSGQLIDDVVLYLPLEGDSTDFSGRSNNGTIFGAPTFDIGLIGTAATFTDPSDPHQYIDVGSPEDLNFGTATDFSVSVWVNNIGGFPNNSDLGGSNDDPAIVSNKDWNSGNNAGWVISAGGNGRWQWNIGDGGGRADYDGPANQIDDGNWHHLCVTHDRDGVATLYYDGNQVATRDISGIGDINSALPTAVATDGTFGSVWANWFPGSIDEVIIWRRVVTGDEVASLFTNGSAGQPLLDTTVDARITQIVRDPDSGTTTLTFDAPIGSEYIVAGSNDLASWGEVTDDAIGIGVGSTVMFNDTDADGKSRRFYRLELIE